jgi:SAM-dependent methyltransferase
MGTATSGYAVSRAQWNRLAARFNSSVCDIVAGDRDRIVDALVEEALRRRPKPVVIDLGCGMGTFVRRYGRRFGETIGVDFAERMLRGARRRCAKIPRVRWVCASVEEAPEKVGETGEITVCFNVITSPDATIRRRQWKALGRITKPGGSTIVVLPSLESSELVAQVEDRLRPGSSGARSGDGTVVNRGKARQKHYTRGELRAAAERAGFRVSKIVRVYYPWRDEGVDAPQRVTRGRQPWDWAVVGVRRSADGR